MVIFCFILVYAFSVRHYLVNSTNYSLKSIEQRIAEEVAENHLKLKPLEINFDSMQGISNYFKQLGFEFYSHGCSYGK